MIAWRRDIGLVLVVLAMVLAVALYASTVGRGLVGLDDPWLIEANYIVQSPSLDSVRSSLFDTSRDTRAVLGAEYLPVRDLSIMLDVAVWGPEYGGFHLTNVALYAVALPLWFMVLVGFGIERRVAGLAILLYAVHPAHAESVAWLSERKGLLALVFAGLAGVGYTRYRAGRSAAWLVVALAAAVLAVWSKALGAFAVAMLAALELVFASTRVSGKRSFVGLTALGVGSGLAFVPVLHVASEMAVVASDVSAPGGHGWLATVAGVHGFHVRLAAMLVPNAVSYPINTVGPSAADIALGITWLAVIGAVAFAPRLASWRPSLVARAAAVIWLVGWFPVSRIALPVRLVVVADRYLLLSTLGFSLAVAGLICALRRRTALALAVAVIVASGARTLSAQASWRSSETLWAAAVESNPGDGDAWAMYAESLRSVETAAAVIAEGMRHSASPRLRMHHALVLLRSGERDAGQAEMTRAAEAGEPVAMSNLSLLLLDDGTLEVALDWARRGAALTPLRASSQRTHGKVALAAGQPAEALGAFERARRLEPGSLEHRYNLALALAATGRIADARRELEACLVHPTLAPLAREQLARLPR